MVDDDGKTVVLNCTMVRNPLVYFSLLLDLCLVCILQVLGLFACKMRKSKSFPEPNIGPAAGEQHQEHDHARTPRASGGPPPSALRLTAHWERNSKNTQIWREDLAPPAARRIALSRLPAARR